MAHDHHSHNHHQQTPDAADPLRANDTAYRNTLWIALALNASMFVVEVLAGKRAESSALLADATDFMADAVNYGLSLWALSQASRARALVALFKGAFMTLFGIGVLAQAL